MNTKEIMNSEENTPRFLGAVFLFQAVASLVSGIFLLQPLIVSDSIVETMANISNNPLQFQASIVVDMFTAMGIVALGSLLFVTLKKQNGNIALVALGLYILEAVLLAASRIAAFALLQISQESVILGNPDYMQTLGNLFYKSQDFGYSLHMLPFALGATLFYLLLFKSGYIPKALSLLGLVAAPLALIGILFTLLGYDVPIAIFILNLPFELGIGIWLIVKGFNPSAISSESA
jgi:hypothetical protein